MKDKGTNYDKEIYIDYTDLYDDHSVYCIVVVVR